jgi:hypothetical protein
VPCTDLCACEGCKNCLGNEALEKRLLSKIKERGSSAKADNLIEDEDCSMREISSDPTPVKVIAAAGEKG